MSTVAESGAKADDADEVDEGAGAASRAADGSPFVQASTHATKRSSGLRHTLDERLDRGPYELGLLERCNMGSASNHEHLGARDLLCHEPRERRRRERI